VHIDVTHLLSLQPRNRAWASPRHLSLSPRGSTKSWCVYHSVMSEVMAGVQNEGKGISYKLVADQV
jgi:hypothetical protein